PPPPPSALFPYTTLFRSLLAHALPDVQALGEFREVAVPGADAVRMPDFDQVAVPAAAPRLRDDAIRRRAHGRSVRRRVVGPLVRSEEHTSELQSLRHLVC